jgi:hypothetical protein
MEEEQRRFNIIVKKYNQAQPNINNSIIISDLDYFNVSKTRILYMKIFNEVPPENIWNFRKILNLNTITIIISNDINKFKKMNIQIMGLNIYIDIKTYLIKNNEIKNSDKVIFISSQGIIDFNSKINNDQICVLIL